MIHTFKFKPKFEPGSDYPGKDYAVLGAIPNGRILESKPVFDESGAYWLVVVDDSPERPEPREIYSGQ